MTNLQLVLAFGSLIVVGAAAIWLGISSDMLRDSQPVDFGGAVPPTGGQYRRPYSLAQTQMTWWFCIILSSFLYIASKTWTLTGILQDQNLILMGIGTGTALGAVMIEQVKQTSAGAPPKTKLDQFNAVLAQIQATGPTPALLAQRDALAAELSSQNFLRDILSDEDGVCLHRFQAVAWTLVLGVAFLINAITAAKMLVFDTDVLAVLGISAATYLGFKVPEQP